MVTTALMAAAARVCNAAIGLLELVDRPFKVIGPDARRLIGWLAIATMGASLMLLAFPSLL